MQDAASTDRTVIFVSHDMAAIERVCDRVLVMEHGRILPESTRQRPQEAVAGYLAMLDPSDGIQAGGTAVIPGGAHRSGTGEGKVVEVTLRDADGRATNVLGYAQGCAVSVVLEWSEPIREVAYEVGVTRSDGHRIVTAQSIDGPREPVDVSAGRQEVTVALADLQLLPGDFYLDVACHRMDGNTIDFVERCLFFRVLNGMPGEDRYLWPGVRGYVRAESVWREHDVALPATRQAGDTG